MINMKKRIFISLTFLIFGVIIYFLFDIGLMKKSITFCSIIRNYLPDICWTFSFFFMSINFTSNITKKSIVFNSLYVLFIAMIYEFLQYYKIISGTFDLIDISLYIVSIIFACLVEIIIRRNEYEKI